MSPVGTPPLVEPVPVGTEAALAGAHLEAEVTLAPEASSVTYEVQLGPRAPAGDPLWDHPIWAAAGGPLAPAASFWFETLDGCGVSQGMVIANRRPVVRVGSSEPITAYAWRLSQHRAPVESTDSADDGIGADGCFTFQPTRPLTRRGRLPRGYFFPPFDRAQGGYNGRTYGPGDVAANPEGHHAYAVDFNHGSGDDDLGHPVLAAAVGTVTFVDGSDEPGHGTVKITHGHGRFVTQYTHMRDIRVKEGDRVKLLQQIGEIGSVGASSPHLHHAHFRKQAGGGDLPIKMRFGRTPCEASLAAPRDPHEPIDDWRSPKGIVIVPGFRGWERSPEATLRVKVRWTSTGAWSEERRLKFIVSRDPGSVPACPDPGCVGAGMPGALVIDQPYGGPELAEGEYSVRYRCEDDLGNQSDWVQDDSLVIDHV